MKKLITLFLAIAGCVGTASAATVIHFLPGPWETNDNERYALYLYWDGGNKWLDFSAGDFNAWDVTIDTEHEYTGMILCRMNGDNSENNWENKWNQTGNITSIPTVETWYEMTQRSGDNDFCTISTSSKTIYIQERGTSVEAPEFYCCYNNGSDIVLNGSYPGYTLKSKIVDGETWYGFTTINGDLGIISNNGDSDKTGDISLPSTDAFYFYYPDSRSYAKTESKFVSGTYKYATFGSTNNIYFGFLPTNVTASLVKVEGGDLETTSFTGDLIAGEGILLDNETGADITLHLPIATSSPSSNSNNQLVAITDDVKLDQTTTGYTNYILTNKKADGTTGDVKFYKVNTSGSYVNAGTAYLKVPDGSGLAREFYWFGSESSAIDEVDVNEIDSSKSSVYNLAGQRISQPQKGIYIINGKKYIAK